MREMRNLVVQLGRYGAPDELAVVEAPMPVPGPGEVRVRVLASGVEYTDTLIRRHLYVQTIRRRPPFTMGYDLVGQIDRIGEGVRGFQLGERVADMTVIGANATYCILPARNLARVPAGIDAAEAAGLILSWTTAYQLLHRAAQVRPGQRVLVHGAAGAVGQALLVLGGMAGVELWGTARDVHAPLVRALGATPIDYQREDFTKVLPDGFDAILDGIAQGGFAPSLSALRRGGVLCAYGYTAAVSPELGPGSMLLWLARQYLAYLCRWRPTGRRLRIYSINAMRALHPDWFQADLEQLFDLLARGVIHPRIAERISLGQVASAHRRLEAGGLDGKLILCPE